MAAVLAGGGLTLVGAPTAHAAAVTDSVVKLPISSFSQFAVDSANQRVWIADENIGPAETHHGKVLAYDFGGALRAERQTDGYVTGIAVEPNGSRVHVGQRDSIRTYDQNLAPLGVTPAPVDDCGRELAHAGGLLFFTSQEGGSPDACAAALATISTTKADGTTPSLFMYSGSPNHLVTGPGDMLMNVPERTATNTDPNINLYRVVQDAPDGWVTEFLGETWLGMDGTGQGGADFRDAAFSPDGSTVALADGDRGTVLLRIPNFDIVDSPYTPLPEGAQPTAVAYSGDGKWFARGAAASGSTPDLTLEIVDPADTRPPVEMVFEGADTGDRVVRRGVAFSADSRTLFVVTSDAEGTEYWLHTIQTPDGLSGSRFADGLTYDPAPAVAGEQVTLRGRLELESPAPAAAPKVEVVREDAQGTHALGSVTADTDGTFTVQDEPDLVGEATYRFRYAGDSLHRPAEDALLTVQVAKATSVLTLAAPAEASQRDGVEISGSFTAHGRPLAEPAVLSVRVTDRTGTAELAPVTVAADGTFTVRDTPRDRKEVTYTVTWAGDDLHEGAEASAMVFVRR